MTVWRTIQSVPRNGTPVLVWLPEAMVGSHVHGAVFRESGPSTIGSLFAFDVEPAPTFGAPQPTPPDEQTQAAGPVSLCGDNQ